MSTPAAIAKRTEEITLGSDHTFDAGDPCDALYIGTGGDVTITDCSGVNSTFKNLPNAAILDVGAAVIVDATTTASDIVALWF